MNVDGVELNSEMNDPQATGRPVPLSDERAIDALLADIRRTTASRIIVIRGGVSWDGTMMGDQHVALRLAESYTVIYVDKETAGLRLRPGPGPMLRPTTLSRIHSKLYRLQPRVPPGKSYPGMQPVTDFAVRKNLDRLTRHLRRPVHAVISVSADGLSAVRTERRIYWSKDDYVAGAGLLGWPRRRLIREELRVKRLADTIVASSPVLYDKWKQYGREPIFIPNGTDYEHFAPARRLQMPADVDLRAPIAVFVGTISNRIDFSILESVLDSGVSLLMVGPRQRTLDATEFERLLLHENAQWLGAKPFSSLPAYVGVASVGVLPYHDSEFNRASFPLKTLEYMAAGLPVVSTDMPSIRWLNTDLIQVASDANAFAPLVYEAAQTASDHKRIENRMRFAERHDWRHRADQFVSVLAS